MLQQVGEPTTVLKCPHTVCQYFRLAPPLGRGFPAALRRRVWAFAGGRPALEDFGICPLAPSGGSAVESPACDFVAAHAAHRQSDVCDVVSICDVESKHC